MGAGTNSGAQVKPTWLFGSARARLVLALTCLMASAPLAAAQNAISEQDRLYAAMVQQPTNYSLTAAYVKTAESHGDYEAAIGALERLLFYNPDLPQVKYQLGGLYYRLGVYEMAKRYFTEALTSPSLDSVTRAQIEAALANSDKMTQRSRLALFAQVGVRSQSNANYAPSSGVVEFDGYDFALNGSQRAKPDGNAFQMFGLSHDFDLQGASGIVIETRMIGYATEQFRFSDLNVALIDGSFGPRIPLAFPGLPVGTTVKPYVAGGHVIIGGASYFTSGGGGLSFGVPVTTRLSFEPNVEVRDVTINQDNVFASGFNSGVWTTGGLSSAYTFNDQLKFDGRVYYRRGTAREAYQAFDQWVGEASLSYQFTPLVPSLPVSWSVSPFGRVTHTSFERANPFIDPDVTRVDTEYGVGVVLSTPISKNIGVSTTAEFDYTNSTITNYRQRNLSFLTGPTIRF